MELSQLTIHRRRLIAGPVVGYLITCAGVVGCQSFIPSQRLPDARGGDVPTSTAHHQVRYQDLGGNDPTMQGAGSGEQESGVPPVADRAREMVLDVRLTGNTNLPSHQIMRNVRTRPGRFFDPDLLRQDVDRLWKMKELRRVNGPFVEKTDQGVIVTIEVVERQYLKKIRFAGNRAITDWQLKREIQLKENQPLEVHEVRMARQQLEDYYRREGYLNTQVTVQELAETGDQDVVFVINEGTKERVGWVEFQGNQFATDARLRTFVKAKPGFSTVLKGFGFDRDEVEQDVLRLTAYYRTFGFFNARIGREIVQDPGNPWVRIRYVIDEGPRFEVNGVSFIGNQVYTHDQLLTLVKLKPADGTSPQFNSGEMNADLTSLRDLYGSEGYVFADIQVEPRFLDEPGKLDLVFKVDEGMQYRVGKINVHIDGDSGITKRQVILNRMAIQPGEIADARKLRWSEGLLKRAQLFSDGSPGSGPPPRVVVSPKELQELERVARQEPTDH